MTFPGRLKQSRKASGLSQMQLSIKSGIAQNMIWAYESGKRMPSAYTLCRLADALDVSMDYLYGRSDTR